MPHSFADAMHQLAIKTAPSGLAVRSPHRGALMATIALDSPATISDKLSNLTRAQGAWAALAASEREKKLVEYAGALKEQRELMAAILSEEAGKTMKEALAETDSAEATITNTIKQATLPEQGGMNRRKERPPVGVVGLITSFNFPIAVAHWSLAPALLSGNGVLWKPSEKTPLTALAVKAVFDRVMGAHAGLLEVAIGGREVGEALVAHESVDMVSATGSVGMGMGIKKLLAAKKNNSIPPILELGGNNGVVISNHVSKEHLNWSLAAILTSFLGTTGQRCTNTRRLFIQRSLYDESVSILEQLLREFMAAQASDPENAYGYAVLIDEDGYRRFEAAKAKAQKEGGRIVMGAKLDSPAGVYRTEPALVLLSTQTATMHEETFAPLLYVVPYETLNDAISMVNAPDNSGLVAAIYTQSQSEADLFAARAEAGHILINSPKGTGTPAYGMGFGGNKHSGCGEILNSADPLAAFTRQTHFRRIAQNKDVVMN
ncbi:MAG: aldehyde dehydrogenase family protein [Alphaproteobacteria bacterium]|nr:aldehyde dehydrogenase family protein [Alphaproteobacteria bacterium]